MPDLNLLTLSQSDESVVARFKNKIYSMLTGRYSTRFDEQCIKLGDINIQYKCIDVTVPKICDAVYLSKTLDFVLKDVKGYLSVDSSLKIEDISVDLSAITMIEGRVTRWAYLYKAFGFICDTLRKDINDIEVAFVGKIDDDVIELIYAFAGICNFLTIVTDDVIKAYNMREKVAQNQGLSIGVVKRGGRVIKDADIVILNDSRIEIGYNNVKKNAIICCLSGDIVIDAYVRNKAIIFDELYITNDYLDVLDPTYRHKRYSYKFIEGILFCNNKNNIKRYKRILSYKDLQSIWEQADEYKFIIKGILYKDSLMPLDRIKHNYNS